MREVENLLLREGQPAARSWVGLALARQQVELGSVPQRRVQQVLGLPQEPQQQWLRSSEVRAQ